MVEKLYIAEHPVRFVTASSLFDGHDASINIMRRILQSQGAEVDDGAVGARLALGG